jgi:hypothetical protein
MTLATKYLDDYMESALYTIASILSLVGLFDLIRRFREFWKGSIGISLKSPENVLKWQSTQIAYASYIGAKKLLKVSKQISDPYKRQKAMATMEELLAVRKYMYETVKKVGYSESEFKISATRSNELIAKYMAEFGSTDDELQKHSV